MTYVNVSTDIMDSLDNKIRVPTKAINFRNLDRDNWGRR